MAESYLEIREQLEAAISALALFETDLGSPEEAIQPIHTLAENLHSPFCLVFLGEKGAGKSSLLNAFIREDLSKLEVTEEKIQVFRYGKKESNRLIVPDLEECCRPLPFLRNFTLIDTPAALLLGDALLLTRDIFPIADLVLCVFSVNNPWAPSTWEFLRNVKKEWLSKVVFVVQQTDLCEPGEAASVSKSLAGHSQDCLEMAPVLFEVSAKQAMLDPDSRQTSGIEALEKFIEVQTAANNTHVQKARVTCQAARGPLIDIAERVRGTFYLANLEKSKIDALIGIVEDYKQRARKEVKQIIQSVTDSYTRSQAQGEELLKSRLSLLETLKAAFLKNRWKLPFQEELETEVRNAIATAAESIKTTLLEGSQSFLESSSFSTEEERQNLSSALNGHAQLLSEQIKRTLARNRAEGMEDVMSDLLDEAGHTIRNPAMASLAGLIAMGVTCKFPIFFGFAAGATAIAMTVTLLIVVQKHGTILTAFKHQIDENRERILIAIERQLNEAIENFCNKLLLMVPPTSLPRSAHRSLEPFLPRIKELENSFAQIDSKLSSLLKDEQ